MSNIAKMQEEYIEISDYKEDLYLRLDSATTDEERNQIWITLSQIDNTLEILDLDIKQAQAHEDMEEILDPVGSFEKYAEEHEKYCGGPPDSDDIYWILGEISRLKAEEKIDETVQLPDEPINSWEF